MRELLFALPLYNASHPTFRLQTPVYALYAIPTIVCASIFLTTRKLGIPLPCPPAHEPWWELFDADWTDMWTVAGHVMRLYREREPEERKRVLGLLTKGDVRRWLDDNVKDRG
jgi:cyclin L